MVANTEDLWSPGLKNYIMSVIDFTSNAWFLPNPTVIEFCCPFHLEKEVERQKHLTKSPTTPWHKVLPVWFLSLLSFIICLERQTYYVVVNAVCLLSLVLHFLHQTSPCQLFHAVSYFSAKSQPDFMSLWLPNLMYRILWLVKKNTLSDLALAQHVVLQKCSIKTTWTANVICSLHSLEVTDSLWVQLRHRLLL